MKYFVKLEGHEFKIIFFMLFVIIILLIANCFRPIELYIDDEILRKMHYGEIQIEKDRNKGESRKSVQIKQNETSNEIHNEKK